MTVAGALVIGDVMLDVIASPDPPRKLTPEEMDYTDATVKFSVGGTGYCIARAASAEGFSPVRLLHSIGDGTGSDRWVNETLTIGLNLAGISSVANVVPGGLTGVAVIGYFGASQRMMFGSPGVNTAAFSERVVSTALGYLSSTQVLFVSGYMLSRPTTAPAVQRLMAEAKRRGAVVALDLVPHSIHRVLPDQEFLALLKSTDLLAGSWSTLAAFGSRGTPELDATDRATLTDKLLSHVSALLVHVPNQCSELRSAEGIGTTFSWPADATSTVRGHTDRVLVRAARTYLSSA